MGPTFYSHHVIGSRICIQSPPLSQEVTSYNFLIKQHPFDLLDWIHLQVSKMLGICFSVFITVSRTRTYTVNVENMPYILFRACFINVAILQCWMRVAVIIAMYLRGTS